MYIDFTLSALRINWIRMKREQFIIRRRNWNVYYLDTLFIQFYFGLYYRRFYDIEIIQNIGRESELNHTVFYVTGLRILEFTCMLHDRG